MLNNCITKNATKLQIKDSPLLPPNVKLMLEAANDAGDILQMNTILQSQGTNLNSMIQKMNAVTNNPLSNVLDDTSSIAGTGISVDQIMSLSNNSVLNMNGVKVAAGSLNSSKLAQNIISNVNQNGGIDVVNAINQNNITDLSGGITDLDLTANNIAKNSGSAAKQAITNALADNAQIIDNLDVKSNVGVNTSFMNIKDKVKLDNLNWVAETSDDINTALDIGQTVQDMSKFKCTSNILAGINDIGTMITSKMIQKSIRGMVDATSERMTASMSEIDTVNAYIKSKQQQLDRIHNNH